MSTPVETTIRLHLQANDAAQETIDWAEIVARLDSDVSVVRAAPRRSSRLGVWTAIAAAVITLLLIGIIPLLRSGDTSPADTLVPTTQVGPLPPNASLNVLGLGAWSVAATFDEGDTTAEASATTAEEVRSWPGVLVVVEVSDASDWLEATGLVSDCSTGDTAPPCGAGLVILTVGSWMGQTAFRLSSEFAMNTLTPVEIPVEFVEGYIDAAVATASPVPLLFDPTSFGTEQPLTGPLFATEGPVCDSCDIFVQTDVEGFVLKTGFAVDSPNEDVADTHFILELQSGDSIGFDTNGLFVDSTGIRGILAARGEFRGRRTYSFATLPLEAALIVYERGDGSTAWQRPIAGMALIVDTPGSSGPMEPLVVLDADGVEIMHISDTPDGWVITDLRFDFAAVPDAAEPTVAPPTPAFPEIVWPNAAVVAETLDLIDIALTQEEVRNWMGGEDVRAELEYAYSYLTGMAEPVGWPEPTFDTSSLGVELFLVEVDPDEAFPNSFIEYALREMFWSSNDRGGVRLTPFVAAAQLEGTTVGAAFIVSLDFVDETVDISWGLISDGAASNGGPAGAGAGSGGGPAFDDDVLVPNFILAHNVDRGGREPVVIGGLPPDASVIATTFRDGTKVWQHPVSGIAIFDDPDRNCLESAPQECSGDYTVLNADGDEILRIVFGSADPENSGEFRVDSP